MNNTDNVTNFPADAVVPSERCTVCEGWYAAPLSFYHTQEECNAAKAKLPPKDEFLDLDPAMRPVAEKYGRELFALVMNAGMAGQALQVIAAAAEKHRSRGLTHAAGVMAQSFNQVSNALVKLKGWDEGMLAQCDRDIMLAFKNKLVVPGSTIILNS